MKRDDIANEKPSREFRAKVLNAAEAELKLLRAESTAVPFWQRRSLIFAGVGALILGLVPFLRRPTDGPATPGSMALQDHEMLENAELLNHLDLLSDLDILEVWNGKDV